jgi:membrane fusion protein (multidrug efflux system)
MSKYFKLVLLIAAAGLLFNSCTKSSADSSDKPATEATKPAAETVVLKKDTLHTNVIIPGELIPYQQVDIYAKVTGFVKELKVDIGSKVKTGQVLVVLEAPELDAQLAAAQSRLKSQEALYTASLANYNRIIETSKTPGTISPHDIEQAEARKSADLANLDAARASHKEVSDIKSYLSIRAPFDGTITSRNINIGAYVGPSGRGSELPALSLQQQDKLRLVVSVPETYAGYLKQGDEVEFKVKPIPSQTFKVKLTRLSGALDQKFRSQRMEADIKNSDGKFLAGTVADITLSFHSSPDAFIVPKSSVINSAEGAFVIRVVDNKAQRVSIKRGLQFKDDIEIFGGLNVDDVLLKKASEEIKDGAAIN